MKVKLLKKDKQFITLAEVPIVRQIILDMKEDECTVGKYAEMAVRAAFNGNAFGIEVLKASASIARNGRVWNLYSDESGTLDIWIDATVCVNDNEFIIIGAYLSDIWQITGSFDQEIVSHMYIRRFKEVE
ncbi:hypothetical protein FMM80_00670 [Schaedlerella arabinosiphila]|uniref:Uncharacterized protein n=1 Tax=Schaedlerella arabinosiphila TaxID=2044587 RepID=A0A9X5C9E4_9FIRM|nr:hypothetical protein [Schaedlerella arabinosiphila]KAI4438931.1 hypothetical protein C824_001411 [Schaedlerella arabinosiphila]NDO67326.1 hypothetical protein [Schaedlerella arabinosiphila]